ncbi:MAG: sigma-54-dependent Fis family transcriptional regulator [bacterium]|nr:MAG: sigma-54-dependent Fis family transcriptional regulator [bacterium]
MLEHETLTAAQTVLVVDDELSVRESLETLLEDRYKVLTVDTGERALSAVRDKNVDLVILDVTMPGMGGMQALDSLMRIPDPPEVVMLSASDSARLGVQAVKNGAFDYIAKPFDSEDLLEVLRRALEKRNLRREVDYLRSEVVKLSGFGDIVGRSRRMQELFRIVGQVCATDSSVLITGESGTGKELIARTIHFRGRRSAGPFVPVNCAAIPQELLESEFFGHEKGSFTGAHERRIGKFELANGGILFLDEISTLRSDLQAKLLRVLQEREFTRVGGSTVIRTDARVISATNQDLRELVRTGQFREDLYYRLNVLPIALPPLRERRGDIPILVRHFLEKIAYRFNRQVADVTAEAMDVLKAYHWPGNIRELENLLERLVAFSSGNRPIGIEDLPSEVIFPEVEGDGDLTTTSRSLLEARDRFERMYILSALRKAGWNQSEAARTLGIHRNTLLKKMAIHGLSTRRS